MDATRVFRSDDRGTTWRVVITDDFSAILADEPQRRPQRQQNGSPATAALGFYPQGIPCRQPRERARAGYGSTSSTPTSRRRSPAAAGLAAPSSRVSKDFLFAGYRSRMGGHGLGRRSTRSGRMPPRSAGCFRRQNGTTGSASSPRPASTPIWAISASTRCHPAFLGSDGGIFKAPAEAIGGTLAARING